jgi:hypothetical protein
MKNKILLLALLFGLLTLTVKSQVDEQTKFKMFCSALDNFSTAPNYIVVRVKNSKTGETKEICTEAPFIQGAMLRETGKWTIDCNNYKTRYFEFSKDSALWNISFDRYSKDELDKYAKRINVAKIIGQIKSGKLTEKTFTGDQKEQVMFAHLMFNNGVLMTRGCLAGNICGLTYYKSE